MLEKLQAGRVVSGLDLEANAMNRLRRAFRRGSSRFSATGRLSLVSDGMIDHAHAQAAADRSSRRIPKAGNKAQVVGADLWPSTAGRSLAVRRVRAPLALYDRLGYASVRGSRDRRDDRRKHAGRTRFPRWYRRVARVFAQRFIEMMRSPAMNALPEMSARPSRTGPFIRTSAGTGLSNRLSVTAANGCCKPGTIFVKGREEGPK